MIRYRPKWCEFCKMVTDWLVSDGEYLHCARCKVGEMYAEADALCDDIEGKS